MKRRFCLSHNPNRMPTIASMTGYGRAEVRGERLAVTVEARSLNHRYLEVSLRLPRPLTGQEQEVRRLVQGRFSRGRFDLTVALRRLAAGPGTVRVDLALAQEYLARAREVAQACHLDEDLTLVDLLQCPGVLVVEEAEGEDREGDLLLKEAADQALTELERMRQAEGATLAAELEGHLVALETWIEEISALVPQAAARQRERLLARVRDLLGAIPLDEVRIAQEVALWAAKADVAEEVARLRSHVTQARGLLARGGPVGRSLDFLVQEMQREVSTIAAKADDGEVTHQTLGARAELERLREQIQNLE